uniref:Chemokine interleukin-8-like domain-containing protein n=1 Tax=Oryzias latipes TaxID=8090 RepID=A0A3P9KU76_ORYLA
MSLHSLILDFVGLFCSVGFHHSTVFEKCCFEFSEEPLELRRVTGIIRTPQRCQHQAIIVEARRYKFCVSKTSIWDQNLFYHFRNLENIGDEGH